MELRSFVASSRLLWSNANRRNWSGEKNFTLIVRRSTPMPTWIRWRLVLRLRRERPSNSISPPSLPLSKRISPHPSAQRRRLNQSNQRLCLSFFQRSSPKNERARMRRGTTGSPRTVGNNGRYMATTFARRTSKSAPPIRMPRRCG